MKIKSIRVYEKENAPKLLEVEAENGLKGYSELCCPFAFYAIGLIRDKLIGRSIYNTESMELLFNCHDNGPISKALGAVQAAMWDIFGKKVGQPVYNILGGKMDRPIPLAATGWDKDCVTPEEYAAAAKAVVAKGYKVIKFNPLHNIPFETLDFHRLIMTPAVEAVKAVKEAVGPDVQIQLDLNHEIDHDQTMALFKEIEDMNIYTVANPCCYGDFAGEYKLAQTFDQPMQDGAGAASVLELDLYVEKGDVTTVEYDVNTVGGICEARYIAVNAEAYYRRTAHTYKNFGGFAANIVIAAVSPNLNRLDINVPDFEEALKTWKFCHEIKDGMLYLNDAAAGLGIEPDLTGYKEVLA